MSFRSAFNWNHDFPRLVRQLGFKFISSKPKVLIDWNLIGCLDIENIILNAEVYVLEKHINDVIYYSLQEEEIKILDPKFVKLFRIAQLTVEYLIFCLHYLDKAFVQIQSKLIEYEQQNEELCNEIAQKDKCLQKNRKKIEELELTIGRLTNNLDGDVFECGICKKRFLSDSYLKSHQNRRHSTPITIQNSEASQPETSKSLESRYKEETSKLFLEIKNLKERLNSTEKLLKVDKIVTKESVETIPNKNLDMQEDNLCDSNVQCNLIDADDDKENKIEIIRNELREWRQEEASHILIQLEGIKEKFNLDFQRACELQATKTVNQLPEAQGDNITVLEDKIDKKLKSTVDRLKDDLAIQEQKWREKLNKLELKSDIISELTYKSNNMRPGRIPLMVQHNVPVNIKYNNTSSSSSPSSKYQKKEEPLKHQKQEESLKYQKEEEPLKCSRQTSIPNFDIPTQNKSTSSTSLINNEVKAIEKHETSTLATQTNDFEQTELREVFKPKVPIRKSIFTKTAKVESSDENSSLRNQKQDNVKMKISQSTLGNRSITSLKDAVWNDPNFLSEFRSTIKDVLNETLKDLGIDPQWESIPKETFDTHMKTIHHTQSFIAKTHPNYFKIKNEIINEINHRIKNLAEKQSTSEKPKTGYPAFNPVMKQKPPINTLTLSVHQQKLIDVNEQLKVPEFSDLTPKKHRRRLPSLDAINSENLEPYIKKTHRTGSLDRNIPDTQSPLRRNSEDYPRRLKRSDSILFSSLTRLKNKVVSVFKINKPPEDPQINKPPKPLRPWGGKPELVNKSPVKSEGLYKLTMLDKDNNRIPTKDSIVNITPIKKGNYPKPAIRSYSNKGYLPSSTTNSEDEREIHQTHKVTIQRPLSNTPSIPSISTSERTEIEKHDPKPSVLNSFMVKSVNKEPMTSLPTKVVTMYGDSDSDSSESVAKLFQANMASTPNKSLASSIETPKSDLKKKTILNNKREIFQPIKKKVLFNLSKLSGSSKSQGDSNKSIEDQIKDLVGTNLPEENIVFKTQTPQPGPSSQMYNDDTSISSSVLDGSIKNSAKDEKPKKKLLKVDDLVLSDFEFSSN